MLQIEAAFGHLIKYNDSIDRDVRFAVTCGNSGGSKGIHLRGNQALKPAEIPVKVNAHRKIVIMSDFEKYTQNIDVSSSIVRYLKRCKS